MEPSAPLNNSPASASSPTIFSPSTPSHPFSSYPSSKDASSRYSSHDLPSSAFDKDLSPNSYPFGSSARPSVSNGIRIEQGEQDLPLDFYLDFEGGHVSGSGSSGSAVDEVGGFFNDFELSASTSSALPPLNHPTPPSPSSTDSNLPLQSPLLVQSVDAPGPSGWNTGEWDSVNPFASESLLSSEGGAPAGSTRPSVEFIIVKSLEETRTPQACQACRSRKSKCDGKASCVRCENRRIKCVYLVPGVRGKRPDGNARSFSTSSLASSSYADDNVPTHPPLTKSTVVVKSGRGVGQSRRQSSNGDWEGGIQGWGNEVDIEPAGSRRSFVESRRISYTRPQTDPYPSPRVPLPFGFTRLPTSPSYHHHHHPRSSTSRSISYPSSYDDRTAFQPHPHHHLQHRHSIALFPQAAPPTPTYTQTFQSYDSNSPVDIYPPTFAVQTQYSPNLGTQPLLLDGSDASPFVVGNHNSHSHTYAQPLSANYHIPAPPTQPFYHQTHHRQASFPSVQAPPSSGSHLGLYPPSVSLGREESRSYVVPASVQQAWEEDNWVGMGYSG